ncbi:MAG: N-acetyltransferase [Devosia sp.]|uniref:GNAT family N-acetyltransferase n=1 Tax=Devosia sp. TaxID=1871048 RepID=UPI002623FDE3|nr:GNAT family protein [Devosia sp.]MDB5539364.1 N-acetyltransferase [Devosia sp.]
MPDFPIETARLALRNFQKSDLDAVMAYHALPEVQRYLDWKARDRVEVKAALDAMCAQQRLHRPGDVITLAVVKKSDGLLVGQVSLKWTDATAGQAELRFILSPTQRQQGYARESVRAALDLGFNEFGLHRIFARCSARNEASAKLLKELGMRLEAHFREHALFQGEWDEELHFAILDREWLRGSKVKELKRNMVA